MNCNELLDCIGQVQDSYIAGSVPAEKPRRKSRRAVYWAAAAVLAVVLCAAGIVLFSGGTPVDPNGPMAGIDPAVTDTGVTDPDPIVSEYDVFSDPNVLWGSGEGGDDDIPAAGQIMIGEELNKLLSVAEEHNKVAFWIIAAYKVSSIDKDQIPYPEETEENQPLISLLDKLCTSTSPQEIEELTQEIQRCSEMLYREYKGDTWSWCYERFFPAFHALTVEMVRERLVECGFTPICSPEEAQTKEEQLSFVGTREQILSFIESIDSDREGYYLFAVGEGYFDD